MKIIRKIFVPASPDRVLLLAWSTTSTPRVENVVCVDAKGAIRWRAKLPEGTKPDCFNSLRLAGGVIVATTYRGKSVRLCSSTGLGQVLATPSAPLEARASAGAVESVKGVGQAVDRCSELAVV
jgi:hypothetical protein